MANKQNEEALKFIKYTKPAFAIDTDISSRGKTAIVIDSIFISEDTEHGCVLLKEFLKILSDRTRLPDYIFFYSKGVLLLSEENKLNYLIKPFEKLAVTIQAAEESVFEYNIQPNINGLIVSNMENISKLLLEVDKVIRL